MAGMLSKKYRVLLILLCVVGVVILEGIGVVAGNDEQATKKYETTGDGKMKKIDQAMFLKVPINTEEENACSPFVGDPEWAGVIIQAPEVVLFEKTSISRKDCLNHESFAVVPLCGFYSLPVTGGKTTEPMTIVAEDIKSRKVYRGIVHEEDPNPIVPPPTTAPKDPKMREGVFTESYFNPNLVDFVDIPHVPAVYNVHIEFWGYKSNTVTIELRERK